MSSAEGVPTVVGGYEVLGQVGSGTTGTVFKARDAGLGRDVALKRVPASSVAGLRAEAARLAALDDPHVVSVFGFVEEPDAAYLVLEWVEGATLAEVLAAGGKLSVAQALGVTRGALLGLSHAHDRGVVHGDVSASNVLVDTAGDSRLIDFGVGGSTPAYRAPEVAAGSGATPASDVYSAAAVLVHLLTGRMVPDSMPDVSHVDAGIRPVLAKALAAAPGDRYPDAAAFLAALEEAGERTYGAAWWTTAGVPALVAPAVAVLVPLGGGAAGAGVGGVIGTTIASGGAGAAGRKGLPWKAIAAAGAAALVIVAGGVTALALAGGSDDPETEAVDPVKARLEKEKKDKEAADQKIIDSVPNGFYTYRGVVTKTGDPSWFKVGELTGSSIWTITADCATVDKCGGTIESTSGNSYGFTWDGTALTQIVDDRVDGEIEKGTCNNLDTGEEIGTIDIRSNTRPLASVYQATGATVPETGLPAELALTYKYTETIVAYDDYARGSLPPKECAYTNTNKVKRSVIVDVTLTAGADPKVEKAEKKRIAEEKADEEKASDQPSDKATP